MGDRVRESMTSGNRLSCTQLSRASRDRRRIGHADDVRAFARSLQQPRKHAARPEFDEQIAAAREQPFHAISPAHRARDLILQGPPNLGQRVSGLTGDIAQDRKTRQLQLCLEQLGAELHDRRCP